VIGTPEDATKPVIQRLTKCARFQPGVKSHSDPMTMGDMSMTLRELCRNAGVTQEGSIAIHSLRRRTAYDLNHVPSKLWQSGADLRVADVLGQSKSSTDKHLSEQYAQASTVDAARARESILPTLGPNDDGTAWTWSTTYAIPMVKSIHNINPRDWTFAHDRFAVADLSASMAKKGENPSRNQVAAAQTFFARKMEMQRRGHWETLPWMRKELKDLIASHEPVLEDNHTDPVLLHVYDLGGAALCDVRTPNSLSSNRHPSPDVRVLL
jgi:hypothetical protein